MIILDIDQAAKIEAVVQVNPRDFKMLKFEWFKLNSVTDQFEFLKGNFYLSI